MIHGHQFDGLVHFNRVLERVGSVLYDWILDFNSRSTGSAKLGFGYWSLTSYLKLRAKSAVKYVTDYEGTISSWPQEGDDGVICGHIHRPKKDLDGACYT